MDHDNNNNNNTKHRLLTYSTTNPKPIHNQSSQSVKFIKTPKIKNPKSKIIMTDQQQQERILRPIYNFLDTYNYTKALKLTYSKPQCNWPITIALRAHCLQKIGKTFDACCEIRALLVTVLRGGSGGGSGVGSGGAGAGSGNEWSELDEKIWLLALVEQSTGSTVEAAGGSGTGTAASSSSSSSSSVNASKNSSKGKGKKGKKGSSSTSSSSSSSANNASANAVTVTATKSNSNSPLDIVHVLDLPKYKRQEILSSTNYVANTFPTGNYNFKPNDVVEETVIATIAVTLSSLNLHHTATKMYSVCIQQQQQSLSSQKKKPTQQLNQFQRENLCTTLIQGYQSQLRWITQQQSITKQNKEDEEEEEKGEVSSSTNTSTTSKSNSRKEDELYSARNVLHSWEEAQFIAMSLVKYSGSSLYKSWCAFATIQHWKSCEILSDLLNDETETGEEVDKEKKKLEQKLMMLPRLAEMWMKRVCNNNNDDGGGSAGGGGGGGNEFPPSADDWRLFVECLYAQKKYIDGIDILNTVRCGTEKQGRQIDDENDVSHHLGSLIQLSEREKIEMIADLNAKSGNFNAAKGLYADKLLDMLPDQWSYWQLLMKNSLASHDGDYNHAYEECTEILEKVMGKQDQLRTEGKASRVPLRGPHLFKLYIVAEGLRNYSTSDLSGLLQAIEKYGNFYASQVSCCFQDLRPYIELLVEKSSSRKDNDSHISKEVSLLMSWAKEMREKNCPFTKLQEGVEESSDEKKGRRSKLRAYIFSVKVCFEVWYQILSQKGSESDIQRPDLDESFASYIPTVDELVQLWENVLNLGSNPNDGGQKETLPGDDLILLATQLLLHQSQCKPSLAKDPSYSFAAASLLEKAIHKSPYNPYLKIAAIDIYVHQGAATRAWEIFKDLKVVHIQLDSCSYIILGHLLKNGLYREAIAQSREIVGLHANSSRDVSKFMPKSFENGNLHKGHEMMSWQRYEMNHSRQLLEAKSLIMDLALLLTINDKQASAKTATTYSTLSSLHGVTDIIRAEKIVHESSNFYAAPSLICLSNYDMSQNEIGTLWSDNRDFTVKDYEILERTVHPMSNLQYISSAHIHALLVKTVLLVDVAKAPKKGKVVKYSSGDDIDTRVKSLLHSMAKAEVFTSKSYNHDHLSNNVQGALWKIKLLLCQTICILSAGRSSIKEDTVPPNDSLTTRETRCVELLQLANEKSKEATDAWKLIISEYESDDIIHIFELICVILAKSLVPVYNTIQTTAKLFALFNWGKRKRNTKAAVGALAEAALSLRALIEEMNRTVLEALPSSKDDDLYKKDVHELKKGVVDLLSSTLPQSLPYLDSSDEGERILDQVVGYRASHRHELRHRLEPYFLEMLDELDTFNVAD